MAEGTGEMKGLEGDRTGLVNTTTENTRCYSQHEIIPGRLDAVETTGPVRRLLPSRTDSSPLFFF
jgi:hypothetical protein